MPENSSAKQTNQPTKNLPPTLMGPHRVSWNREVSSLLQAMLPLAGPQCVPPEREQEGGAQGCDGHNAGALMRDPHPGL